MTDRTWTALIALVIAVGVSVSVILLAITELKSEGHVTTEEATLLATVLGAALGAVATYLGTHSREPTPPQKESGPPILVTRYPSEPFDQDAPTAETPIDTPDKAGLESDPSASTAAPRSDPLA